jgi:hypothetical protein
MDPDRLAELEEERRFLLRSLDDLEREHAAGDIDQTDYLALRDGYTVRAAATLRAIDDGQAALPSKPSVDWPRRIGVASLTVLLIGIVWWVLAASSAQRLPGQEITGFDPRDDRAVLLAQARLLQPTDPGSAIATYQLVLDEHPDDVEAMTYLAWTVVVSVGISSEGEAIDESARLLDRAIEIDPTYPDPYCFLGIIERSADRLDVCLAANPPAEVRGLVEALRSEVESDGGSQPDG